MSAIEVSAAINGRLGFARREDVDLFVDKLEAFERGELNGDDWRTFRLLNGVYGQRQDGFQMVRAKLRLTSAMRTRRLTCSGVAVLRRLMTLVPAPTKASTRRCASAASSGAAPVPVSSTVLVPIVATATLASGIANASI